MFSYFKYHKKKGPSVWILFNYQVFFVQDYYWVYFLKKERKNDVQAEWIPEKYCF